MNDPQFDLEIRSDAALRRAEGSSLEMPFPRGRSPFAAPLQDEEDAYAEIRERGQG